MHVPVISDNLYIQVQKPKYKIRLNLWAVAFLGQKFMCGEERGGSGETDR